MKLKELQIVNKKVKALAEKENKFFYYGRFIPNTKFMFVGEMPSPTEKEKWDPHDNFNITSIDEKFQTIINEIGFGGSYFTDLVKKTEKPRRPTEAELLTWLPLLALEINIINPVVVVAINRETHNTLEINREKLGIKNLEYIWQPSYAQIYNRWSEYRAQLSDLFNKYKTISN